MIGLFPDPYPDELVYSMLARYYMKSGYPGYVCAAEDLFRSTWKPPSIEFLDDYQPEVYQRLEKNTGMRNIVLNHTMFPVYGMFVQPERRRAAFGAMLTGNGNNQFLLPLNKGKKNDRYLRYCPVCVKVDREKYGETYWHRIHQIYGLSICPRHLCRLYDSDIPIKRKQSPDLITAEEACTGKAVEYSDIDAERNLATYIYAVMMQPVNLFSGGSIGDFLHSVIAETEYSSPRGEQCYITKLFRNIEKCYSELPESRLTQSWMLQKILCGQRSSFLEVCMVAHFLQVSPAELAAMKVPEVSHEEAFDEQVRRLHIQGLSYPEIAKWMNASENIVKPIGEGRYPKRDPDKEKVRRGGPKASDWKRLDEETLPRVREAAKQVWGVGDSRPRRVTVGSITTALKLPDKSFDNMPCCRAEIEKYAETQEEYWARELAWAAKQLMASGNPLHHTALRRLTNMRRCDMRSCIRFLSDHVNADLVKLIQDVIE